MFNPFLVCLDQTGLVIIPEVQSHYSGVMSAHCFISSIKYSKMVLVAQYPTLNYSAQQYGFLMAILYA